MTKHLTLRRLSPAALSEANPNRMSNISFTVRVREHCLQRGPASVSKHELRFQFNAIRKLRYGEA